MTLDQLYAAAQQHVLSRNNPTSPVDVANILLNYIAENGGDVDGTAINPLSIGATTPGTAKVASLDVTNGSQIGVVYLGTTAQLQGFDASAYGANPLWLVNAAGFSFKNDGTCVVIADGSDILAQRRGTNAQESRLYGTYTSSTVYERLSSKYDSGSGVFVIGTEKGASGGSARDLIIQRDGTKVACFDANGVVVGNNIGHCSNNGGLFDIGFGALNAGYPGIRFGSSAFLFSDYLLQYGGQTSSFPALKRNGTGIDFRLADDSADAPITVSTVKTVPVLYSALPAAATIGDGARAFITDGASAYPANIGGTASGGGANPTPVMTLGGAWIYG